MRQRLMHKYEPTSLDTYVWANNDVRDVILTFTELKRSDNLFLWGKPGVGKTLLAKLLPEALLGSPLPRKDAVFVFNAMSEADRSSQTEQLGKSWKMGMIPGPDIDRRIIVINEVADMTPKQVKDLKNILDKIERVDPPFMLITTSNEPIPVDAVVSRGVNIKIPPVPNDRLRDFADYVLKSENVELSEDAIGECIVRAEGSVRDLLRSLETKVLLAALRSNRETA